MKKIEASTLEQAYAQAAAEFGCSVTELQVEIIQFPSKGILGLFKKSAIIMANFSPVKSAEPKEKIKPQAAPVPAAAVVPEEVAIPEPYPQGTMHHDTLISESFVTEQEDEVERTPEDEEDFFEDELTAYECALEVKEQINLLFKDICFEINAIEVSLYDENTLLVEFTGPDAALMIGKEGYRYKALSYMLFNWINATYGMQLRLEIAEFLKNQEESISRYLIGVYAIIDQEGRAQTKVLDGVLVQIALKQLRNRYPDRYVAIRSTREGGKFIVINSYHEY
ncbi:MAG: Jag N-terminal domain-containing protein [Sulfuricurvum sp.]|jgi:spoIIIJ-associated protein|uniref:Jag N-terminal domain-containing protein n=1 Tax=Sulfuricurvum sp. TaxID=2025608 RepID=UPI0025EFA6CF|nr:Jag N-terminal domain-containing protein [Sulfuricurvum sp.]MCK9372770.1 Jag N-terminal domain-containing protein [Sulfuricurvum sp.]